MMPSTRLELHCRIVNIHLIGVTGGVMLNIHPISFLRI